MASQADNATRDHGAIYDRREAKAVAEGYPSFWAKRKADADGRAMAVRLLPEMGGRSNDVEAVEP